MQIIDINQKNHRKSIKKKKKCKSSNKKMLVIDQKMQGI